MKSCSNCKRLVISKTEEPCCKCNNFTEYEACEWYNKALVIEDTVELGDVRSKFNEFIKEQKDIPSEYVDMINENFWDLL